MARNLRRISGALQSAELLTRREFWGRIESGEARTLMVILLRSWRKIATGHGEEAIDIAENMFLNLCRFATSDADLHARLSVSVFACSRSTSSGLSAPSGRGGGSVRSFGGGSRFGASGITFGAANTIPTATPARERTPRTTHGARCGPRAR